MNYKFRKKPLVIEAFQYTDNGKSFPAWWQKACHEKKVIPDFDHGNERVPNCIIQTLEGNMTVQPEDWVIQGIEGELYPCKPEIFAKTYEELPDAN